MSCSMQVVTLAGLYVLASKQDPTKERPCSSKRQDQAFRVSPL